MTAVKAAAYHATGVTTGAEVFIPAAWARFFAVRLGLDKAAEMVSYDECAYEFGSASHEILTMSLR